MVEKKTAIIIGIIIFIIIIIILLFVFFRPWDTKAVIGLNGACDANNVCGPGLTCTNGVCKVSQGGRCTETSDCSTGICLNNICTVIPTTPPNPSPPPTNGVIPCTANSTCPQGYTCQGSIVIESSRNYNTEYKFGDNKVMDVMHAQGANYFLLQSGEIIRVKNDRETYINSNVVLTRIFTVSGRVYGLSNNRLYILETCELYHRQWNWRIIRNLRNMNIYYASPSINQKWLWLQFNENSTNNGILYRVHNTNFREEMRMNITSNMFRVYGYNSNSYIDINPTTQKGTAYLNGVTKSITNIVNGALLSDDTIVSVSKENSKTIFQLRVYKFYNDSDNSNHSNYSDYYRNHSASYDNLRAICDGDILFKIQNKLCIKN